MKKIGIVTIVDYHNYGNRLQNYAVQKYIESFGFQAETVRILQIRKKESFSERIARISSLPPKQIVKKLLRFSINHFLLILTSGKRKVEKLLSDKRVDNFKKFVRQYINETDFSISDTNIPDNLDELFDYYIVGSDQVWNPSYLSKLYFLPFAPKEKKIAFSASFGVSKIPEHMAELYKKHLADFPFISVREYEGADLVRRLIGREVPVLVDPTMLFDAKDWMEIAKTPQKVPNKDYILTYFLGNKSKEMRDFLSYLQRYCNLDIVKLNDLKDPTKYVISPSEFIFYFANSKIVLTDSFHGVVFSILFKKPFIVFRRMGTIDMYSRIASLLRTFNLTDRAAEVMLKNPRNVFDVDFSSTDKILEQERQKAKEFLMNALR